MMGEGMTACPVSHHGVCRAHHSVILRKGCVAHDHVMRQGNPKTNLVIVNTRGRVFLAILWYARGRHVRGGVGICGVGQRAVSIGA